MADLMREPSGAEQMIDSLTQDRNRLRAENERLREGIRQHRNTIQALMRASTPAEHRLWALLDEHQRVPATEVNDG